MCCLLLALQLLQHPPHLMRLLLQVCRRVQGWWASQQGTLAKEGTLQAFHVANQPESTAGGAQAEPQVLLCRTA